MGIDRAYLYFFNDDDAPMLHGSSGITRNFVPKPSYYAMAHLYKTLGDYRFSRIVRQDKDDLCIFEYVNPDKPKEPIWVIWSPTGSQREVTKNIDIGWAKVLKVERMPLKENDRQLIPLVRYSATLEVPTSESPIYLWLKE
jgi:serine/threonine-protein kinase ATR